MNNQYLGDIVHTVLFRLYHGLGIHAGQSGINREELAVLEVDVARLVLDLNIFQSRKVGMYLSVGVNPQSAHRFDGAEQHENDAGGAESLETVLLLGYMVGHHPYRAVG